MTNDKLTELARGCVKETADWCSRNASVNLFHPEARLHIEKLFLTVLQSLNAEHEKQVKELEADRDQLVQLCLQRLALGRRLDWLAENAVVFASEEPALELVIPADRYAQQQQQAQQRLSSNLPKLAREVIDAAMKAELTAAKGVK